MHNITICHHCGLQQKLPPLTPGDKAVCHRCRARLAYETHDTIQPTLALALGGLVLYVITMCFPMLSMGIEGVVQQTNFFSGVVALFEQGRPVVSLLFLFTCIVLPLFLLGGLVYILTPLMMGATPPLGGLLFRAIMKSRVWCMIEVFLLGILVAMIKLGKMADIVPGPAMWAFIGLVFVVILLFTVLNPDHVWRKIPLYTDNETAPASDSTLVTCHSCNYTCSMSPTGKKYCPKCGETLHVRKPKSLQRTWALVIAATILYIPANLLPIMNTWQLGKVQSDTIMSGVIYFMFEGSWHIALVIFVASILIPIMKLVILIYLLISIHTGSQFRPKERLRLYRLTEFVGRWSMVDVYVVTILVALVQLGPFGIITPGAGAFYFAVVVVMTMIAAESFDPRLIWNEEE